MTATAKEQKAKRGTSQKRERNLWDPSAEVRVEAIADRLDSVLSSLENHIRDRKALEEELAEIEDKQSDDARDLKARHYDCEQSIASCRAWRESLRDKLIDTIKEARQGKLIDVGNDDLDQPPERDDAQLRLVHADEPKWHARPCELDMPGPLAAALAKNQLITWGQVAARAKSKKGKGLQELNDLTVEEVRQVEARLAIFENEKRVEEPDGTKS